MSLFVAIFLALLFQGSVLEALLEAIDNFPRRSTNSKASLACRWWRYPWSKAPAAFESLLPL
jgi:hypothetical protein